MTISTPRIETHPVRVSPSRIYPGKGFTLVEAMIATALSAVVLAGIISSFLMIGRTSLSSSRYSQNEAETRRALEFFGQDARLASNILWTNDHNITLTIAPTAGSLSLVTYAYDNQPASDAFGCFYRQVTTNGITTPKQILAREVSELFFQRYKLEQTGAPANEAANDLETKQLQLTLRATRRGATTTIASQAGLSARYILRNKRVSN
ncbi:MAG: prepilin-type N-terminal cleavage/methylation domain-containing protein [Opitutaceae bacterium]